MSSLGVLLGGSVTDLYTLDTLERTADRFNHAAALAAERRMRVGYHNHFWEWNVTSATKLSLTRGIVDAADQTDSADSGRRAR